MLLLAESLESLLELIHASACIDELLLTREEGVALGANFNLHLAALGGLGLNDLAASALDQARLVNGMDSVFHCNTLFS